MQLSQQPSAVIYPVLLTDTCKHCIYTRYQLHCVIH